MEENEEHLQIYSEEVRDILSHPPKAIFKWGSTILLLFVIVLGFISYFIKFPDIVSTQVILTTQNPPEKLVARTSGKIAEILIEDRTEVLPKTALAIIENTANYKDVLALKSYIDTLSVDVVQFNFPLEKCSNLQLGEIGNAFTFFEKDYIAYDINRDLKPYLVEKTAQGLEMN